MARKRKQASPELLERLYADLAHIPPGQLSPEHIRFLVKHYYAIQKIRVASGNTATASERRGQPHYLGRWLQEQLLLLEHDIRAILQRWVESLEAGRWCLAVVGVGPILAAGLLAHSNHEDPFPTAGKLWRYAGLDPTVRWEPGQPRPYNAQLKVLCYKLGESFMKFSNHPSCYYGHIYRARKEQEQRKNEAGKFKDLAARALAYAKDPASRAYYEQGKLPPGRIELRARRYAVKLFLAHYQEVLWFCRYRTLPPKPYVLEFLGKNTWIAPPHSEVIPGLIEAFHKIGALIPHVVQYDNGITVDA